MHAESVRLACSRGRSKHDAHDIAALIRARLWCRLDQFMARYPDPLLFARAVIANAMIDYDRTQCAQRGAGARGVIDADGIRRPPRTVVSGDTAAVDGAPPLFDLLVDPADGFDERIVTMLDTAAAVERILGAVRARDPLAAEALWLVAGLGLTHDEVGRIQGVARETVCRRVARAFDIARTTVAADRSTPD